jgi:menaquinone-9 beta-reductase
MTASVVVAGGGLAGAAAACGLAQAGRPVMLLERDARAADKLCGEFLSREAQLYLSRLGLDVAALGGQPIGHLRLVRGQAQVETKLPFCGLGLSRQALDAALLAHAGRSGAEIRCGHHIRAARSRADGTIGLDVGGLGDVAANTLFLATGKHDLRGLRREPATAPEDLIGLKTYFKVGAAQRRALQDHVEMFLFPDCYAGLLLVEGGRANLCLLALRTRWQRSGGTWEGLLRDLIRASPLLRARLDGSVPFAQRPLAIYRVPYGFVHAPSARDSDSVFRLGDQVGVTPSFSGDGMSIALHSAAVAVQMHLAGRSAASYHRRMQRDIGGQIRRASGLYRLGRIRLGQAALMRLGLTCPSVLRLAASLTRVPEGALLVESAS